VAAIRKSDHGRRHAGVLALGRKEGGVTKIIRGSPAEIDLFRRALEGIVNGEPQVSGFVLFGLSPNGHAFVLHGGKTDAAAEAMMELAEGLAEIAKEVGDEREASS